jgi:proline iminopeptidase
MTWDRVQPIRGTRGRDRWRGMVVLMILALVAGCSKHAPAASADASDTAIPIRRCEYLTVDGAKLFVQIRGADRRAPVLLWLHGGPGGAERPLLRYYNSDLEDHFVVAYWDQRGAGRSFDPKADTHELTVARHLADLDTVVDHLQHTLGRDKIVLLGHSWGGMLGILYAQRRPEKVAALIAVAPLVSPRESQQEQYDFIVTEAMRRQDDATLTRLREIGPPPYETANHHPDMSGGPRGVHPLGRRSLPLGPSRLRETWRLLKSGAFCVSFYGWNHVENL